MGGNSFLKEEKSKILAFVTLTMKKVFKGIEKSKFVSENIFNQSDLSLQ